MCMCVWAGNCLSYNVQLQVFYVIFKVLLNEKHIFYNTAMFNTEINNSSYFRAGLGDNYN